MQSSIVAKRVIDMVDQRAYYLFCHDIRLDNVASFCFHGYFLPLSCAFSSIHHLFLAFIIVF